MVLCILAMVETVFKAAASPFFKRMVTAPVASYQLMLKVEPAVTPTKEPGVLPTLAAWATTKAAAATIRLENCILIDLKGFEVVGEKDV
jgi:hypothetical protein